MLYNNIIIRKAEETRGVKALVVQPKTTASAKEALQQPFS